MRRGSVDKSQRDPAGARAAVKHWNDKHPIGCRVTVRLDSGGFRETRTRSEAIVLSGHTAVIWLEGISGCYALDRVFAEVEK